MYSAWWRSWCWYPFVTSLPFVCVEVCKTLEDGMWKFNATSSISVWGACAWKEAWSPPTWAFCCPELGKHPLISQCLLFQVHFQKGQQPPSPLPAQPFPFLTELSCALSTLTLSGGHPHLFLWKNKLKLRKVTHSLENRVVSCPRSHILHCRSTSLFFFLPSSRTMPVFFLSDHGATHPN